MQIGRIFGLSNPNVAWVPQQMTIHMKHTSPEPYKGEITKLEDAELNLDHTGISETELKEKERQ